MQIRLARAYNKRPSELYLWDYWHEYVPAMEQLLEVPLVDELVAAMFRGKSKGNKGMIARSEPMKTQADRIAAFERLQRENEARKAQ